MPQMCLYLRREANPQGGHDIVAYLDRAATKRYRYWPNGSQNRPRRRDQVVRIDYLGAFQEEWSCKWLQSLGETQAIRPSMGCSPATFRKFEAVGAEDRIRSSGSGQLPIRKAA